jgi:DNA-binding NtrC family response regulator
MKDIRELHNLRKNCEECLKQRIPPFTIDFLILEVIFQTLERNNWNKTWTAQDLGINKRTLYHWIEKLKFLNYPIKDWNKKK